MKKHKIILFGTGSSSEKISNILNEQRCQVVGYADNNQDKQGTFINNHYVYNPEQLQSVDVDYIVIGSIYFNEIYEQLIQLKIPAAKIINIYEYIRYQDVKLKLQQVELIEQPEILITGMSYARYGFDQETLKLPAVNVSFNSQDLFFDLCMATIMLEKFTSIRYAFIGLAYYDFQFDLSLSKEKHLVNRYQVISHISKSLDEKKFESNISPYYQQQLFDVSDDVLSLFVDNFIEKFDHLEQSSSNSSNLDSQRAQLAQTHSSKNYPLTVAQNKLLMQQYLHLLKRYNVKPIIVVHPQEESYRQHFKQEMIIQFNEIIQDLSFDNDFEFVDLYEDQRFSDEDFYDVHHLNIQGAKKVSEIINGYIVR